MNSDRRTIRVGLIGYGFAGQDISCAGDPLRAGSGIDGGWID
jgi:hypothetical protein